MRAYFTRLAIGLAIVVPLSTGCEGEQRRTEHPRTPYSPKQQTQSDVVQPRDPMQKLDPRLCPRFVPPKYPNACPAGWVESRRNPNGCKAPAKCVPKPYERSCAFENPQGCKSGGCPVGMRCDTKIGCRPTACSCESASNRWACSVDCGGGLCVPLTGNKPTGPPVG